MLRLAIVATIVSVLAAMTCARAATLEQLEANKKTVTAFEDAALNQKDYDAAAKYLGPRYTQHNPTAADGPEGLKAFVAFLKTKFPDSHSDITQSFADGDYVILHVHSVREPNTRGRAIVDIFKLEKGK